jgi:hypothetical protein
MKNVEELREFLTKELQRVSDGEITPAAANASANLTGKILSSVKLELEYNKMTGHNPNISFLGKETNNRLKKLEQDSQEK